MAQQRTEVARIVRVYNLATAEEMKQGRAWYDDAQTLCEGWSAATGYSFEQCAGVLAATSQRQSWTENVKRTSEILYTGVVRGLRQIQTKVRLILAGAAPLDVLRGDKIRSFYGCIVRRRFPWVMPRPVIDRHAFDITEGRVTDDKTRKKLELVGEHQRRVDDYVKAAAQLGLDSIDLQAITWIAWRRMKEAGVIKV